MQNVETNLYEQQVNEFVLLDEFLQAVVASNVESVASENIEINLEVENVAVVPEEVLTDTDDETIKEAKKLAQKMGAKPRSREAKRLDTYNASRSFKRPKSNNRTTAYLAYNETGNYLKIQEIAAEHEVTLMTSNLCAKLAKDALDISTAHTSVREREATTCLCVVLADKHRRAKKFVFHNKDGSLQRTMREKAEELGYDIINAEQAHAEGEFMQFLLKREQNDPGRYTHILGMGCSRLHCAECDPLLNQLLGKGYSEFTAAMMCSKTPLFLPISEKQGTRMSITYPASTFNYTVSSGSDAVGDKHYQHYYLSDYLKEALQVSCKLRDLKFGSRFTKKNESVEKQVEER